MKKLLILLFSILISFNSYGFFGLFDKTVCVDTDAQIRGGIYYLPNETKPFTGNNLCLNPSGRVSVNFDLIHKGKVKDGKEDGKWTVWHDRNGQIKSEGNYKDGKRVGKWIKWYKNGQKEYERTYNKDSNVDGKWTLWYKNGQIEVEATFKDGKCISGDCDYW